DASDARGGRRAARRDREAARLRARIGRPRARGGALRGRGALRRARAGRAVRGGRARGVALDRARCVAAQARGRAVVKVLLATTGTSGDVLPFVGLGTELALRGHDVTVLANAHFAPMVARARLGFAGVGEAERYEALTRSPFMGATGSDALRCYVTPDA